MDKIFKGSFILQVAALIDNRMFVVCQIGQFLIYGTQGVTTLSLLDFEAFLTDSENFIQFFDADHPMVTGLFENEFKDPFFFIIQRFGLSYGVIALKR